MIYPHVGNQQWTSYSNTDTCTSCKYRCLTNSDTELFEKDKEWRHVYDLEC